MIAMVLRSGLVWLLSYLPIGGDLEHRPTWRCSRVTLLMYLLPPHYIFFFHFYIMSIWGTFRGPDLSKTINASSNQILHTSYDNQLHQKILHRGINKILNWPSDHLLLSWIEKGPQNASLKREKTPMANMHR